MEAILVSLGGGVAVFFVTDWIKYEPARRLRQLAAKIDDPELAKRLEEEWLATVRDRSVPEQWSFAFGVWKGFVRGEFDSLISPASEAEASARSRQSDGNATPMPPRLLEEPEIVVVVAKAVMGAMGSIRKEFQIMKELYRYARRMNAKLNHVPKGKDD